MVTTEQKQLVLDTVQGIYKNEGRSCEEWEIAKKTGLSEFAVLEALMSLQKEGKLSHH